MRIRLLSLLTLFLLAAPVVFSQNDAFTDGMSWVTPDYTMSQQSPDFNGTNCQNIQYTLSTTSSLGFYYDPVLINGTGAVFPALSSGSGTTMDITITFNTPVSNFGMRMLDLDEDNQGDAGTAEEYLDNVSPPPATIQLLNGINPLFINGSVITPDDGNNFNSNNNPGAWIYWAGEVTTVSFTYNRLGVEYEFVIDSIHFECPCVSEPFDFFDDAAICEGTSATLDATTANATYLWSNGATTPSISVNTPGTYWVNAFVGNCPKTDTAVISLVVAPDLQLGNDTILCEGSELVLNANPAVTPIVWQDGSSSQQYNVTAGGTYIANGAFNACPVSDTVVVTMVPYPIVNLGNDQSICEETALTLDISQPGCTYLWSNGNTTPVQSFSSAGLIWGQVSLGSCATTDSLWLSLLAIPPDPLPNDTIICQGDTVYLQLENNGTVAYEWYNSSSESAISCWEAGSYWVESTQNGCSRVDTFNLQMYPTLGDFFTYDSLITICEDKSALIGPSITSPLIQVLWADGHTSSSISINDAGVYEFTVSTPCEEETHTITVTEERCFCLVYLPNTFTPDNNDVNELFVTQYDCPFDSFELVVFNRWGEIVFSTTDPDTAWDGTYQGKAVQDGTYVYKLTYISAEMETYKEVLGHVNVLR
jgi:gliding motility-associated-like protein